MPVKENPAVRKWVFTGANSAYVVGSFDGEKFTQETKAIRSDLGANYYAVHSYSNTPDGRRVQVGWMNGSEFHGMPFNQQISFPRTLTLHKAGNGYVIKSQPVSEISNLYAGKHEWQKMQIHPQDNPTASLRTSAFHLKSEFNVDSCSTEVFGFYIDNFIISYISSKKHAFNRAKKTMH